MISPPLGKLPAEPLVAACRRVRGDVAGRADHVTLEVVGMDRDRAKLVIDEGIDPVTADTAAVRLGLHPYNVWGHLAYTVAATEAAGMAEVEERRQGAGMNGAGLIRSDALRICRVGFTAEPWVPA